AREAERTLVISLDGRDGIQARLIAEAERDDRTVLKTEGHAVIVRRGDVHAAGLVLRAQPPHFTDQLAVGQDAVVTVHESMPCPQPRCSRARHPVASSRPQRWPSAGRSLSLARPSRQL